MSALEKLVLLRNLFNAPRVLAATAGKPISAYVLPSTDAHSSEYLAECDFRVKFLSGFSGSNAYVIVTNNDALLWTDGRYFVQAEKQLSPQWTLMKQGQNDSIAPVDWLSSNLNSGDCVGFDPELLSFEKGDSMIGKLGKLGIKMVPVGGNLVDDFWANRPLPNKKKLLTLSAQETGEEIKSKLSRIREELNKQKCSSGVFAALDDIMWTLNVRGSDIPHNPLAYSYLFITKNEAHFFVDGDKLDDQIRNHLIGVSLHTYGAAVQWLTDFHRQHCQDAGYRVFVPEGTNYAIGSIFADDSITDRSPIQTMKAVKNATEMAGMRESHIRDSAALVEFLLWLEQELKSGKAYTEIQLAYKVDGIRATYEKFVDLSFATISAGGDHAALPHYHAEGEDGQRKVTADDVYLVDSGAQYRDGTTDVTRTVVVHAEKAPAEFIEHNTLVLKGHISLARTIFPDGLPGVRLDTLSRHALWQVGLDFSHGTGHGVGHFLNVHEGPAGIGFRVNGDAEFHAGMVQTIEPGFYLPGKWGIRIENCYETVAVSVPSGANNYLTFAPLTLVPIQTSIIRKDLLTSDEIKWLNAYHDRVLSLTGDYLKKSGKESAFAWLSEQCRHI